MEQEIFAGSEEKKQYGVWAVRSSASTCGAAQTWLKENGKPLQFDTYAQAAAVAAHYNTNCYSANVSYYPKEMEMTIGMDMRLN